MEIRKKNIDNLRITEYILNMIYGVPQTMRGGDMMYNRLLEAMKGKNITTTQIANLLGCRIATASDKINGGVECGFYFDEATKIKQVFFPEYDIEYLFKRDRQTLVR